MSEIRHDFLLPRWVIIAENRADRPNEFVAPRRERRSGVCPFCPGQEKQTPSAIAVRRPRNWNGDETAWTVRVVSNLYPAVELESDACRSGAEQFSLDGSSHTAWPDLRRCAPGAGLHEVVIDTPRHVVSLGELTDADAVELFDVFRERLDALRAAKSVTSAIVFKNVGAAAGASIEHAHTQILATERPIPDPSLEWNLARNYREREGASAFCRMVDAELESGARIVEENRFAIVLCPFASRLPYEMCVLPRGQFAHLARCPPETLAAMATLTRRAIARLERLLDRPAYNFVVHTAPLHEPEAGHFRWHVEIYPRITSWAGFEVGGGCYINPVSPERAAERLRRVV
jgi:UDPglucose--hexose-1-phosphate uridylyltransferase